MFSNGMSQLDANDLAIFNNSDCGDDFDFWDSIIWVRRTLLAQVSPIQERISWETSTVTWTPPLSQHLYSINCIVKIVSDVAHLDS